MKQWTYLNDQFIASADAVLHSADLSIQRGYGVFDYCKTIDNKPVFIEEHLQRFYYSAQEMHLPVMQSPEELRTIILTLIERNQMGTSGIRLTLTGGYSPDGYAIATPNLIISQSPLALPAAATKGIRLMTYEHLRTLPHIKSINYLMAVWLQPLLKEKGADDILYHSNGVVSECPRANFFIVKDKVIITPSKDILSGITRNKLLTYARKHFTVEERDVTLGEVLQCQEAFITSTTKQVLPVISIDGKTIGQGQSGPVTQQLYESLTEMQMAVIR